MKYITSCVAFFCFCAVGFNAKSQPGQYVPSFLRVSADVAPIGNAIFNADLNYFELSAEIDSKFLLFVADYGNSRFENKEEYHNYVNEGNYFRLGLDFNISNRSKGEHSFAFGMRYAQSFFDEEINYSTINAIETNTRWPESMLQSGNENASGYWFELTTVLKARVVGQFYLGYALRFKINPTVKKSMPSDFTPYYLPGYGKLIDQTTWGFNFYVAYRFKWRDRVIPPKEE